uniref:G_PROTEIN_RECEP_F1_2 domain-containing protein n=1 Tax=Ascaris lumbricoides TaxID=6252 RepID=A0A0M3HHQ9_ASCLU
MVSLGIFLNSSDANNAECNIVKYNNAKMQSYESSNPLFTIHRLFAYAWTIALPSLMFFIYIAIFLEIRRMKNVFVSNNSTTIDSRFTNGEFR